MEINFEELAKEYIETGISLTKLAKKVGTTRVILTNRFKKMGIEIVNRWNSTKFNDKIFDSIDTEEKAYWLGFIFADGNIASVENRKKPKYTLEISLKGSDVEHLRKFNKFMEHTRLTIKMSDAKCNGKIFKRCRWWVTNKHLWHVLNNYGCTPCKSLTLKFPKVSIFKDRSLIRHFIRGYFDGDGCFSRQIHSTIVTPAISILGTPEFIEKVLKYSGIDGSIIYDKRRSNQTIVLWYHKEEGIKFINYLYKDSTIYLDRKYKLYEFFKNGSRSVEEFTELSQSNIGEVCDDNTEIIKETKESLTSLSVEIEPEKSE